MRISRPVFHIARIPTAASHNARLSQQPPLNTCTVSSVHTIRISHLPEDLNDRIRHLFAERKSRASDSPLRRSRTIVETAAAGPDPIYGVNTGFGALASTRIPPVQLRQLQTNLLLSHAVGVGDPIPREITRTMLALKVVSLAQGYSGISEQAFDGLLTLLEKDLIPVVPEKGSVGASGDLAPLAHLVLPLIGRGEIWDEQGRESIPAEQALATHGVQPIVLQPKDGLALINGTQFMAAYAAEVLHRSRSLLSLADIIAAMSLEALQGSATPFDARIHAIRPHPGQSTVASNIRNLLVHSEILESHRMCGKVQDPYSLRCVPQVHGASRDAIAHAAEVVEREINSVTDNPLIFPDGGILSGGNFHGQPLALAIDYAKIALAELASISERRTYLLLEGHDGLPKLLMKESGVNSGFMIPQYTAAALVSENKTLCHPASVDSIPTSLGQEDHVSMGSIGALHLLRVLRNVEQVLAIELFTAAQALDFRAPLRPGRGVEIAHQLIRDRIQHASEDRLFRDDIEKAVAVIRNGEILGELNRQGIDIA